MKWSNSFNDWGKFSLPNPSLMYFPSNSNISAGRVITLFSLTSLLLNSKLVFGIFNLTNPGLVSHNEILEMY